MNIMRKNTIKNKDKQILLKNRRDKVKISLRHACVDCKVLYRPYQGSRCEQGVKEFAW